MNLEESDKFLENLFKKLSEIRRKKALDYASADNVLLNFQQRAAIIKILNIDMTKPSGVALMDTILKIQRISNLINQGATPQNESIEDSFVDGINYPILAYQNFIEQNKND